MKIRIVIEAEVSATIAANFKRNGFTLEPDGAGFKLVTPNTPSIPRRKVSVQFVDNQDAFKKDTENPKSSKE